LQASTIWISKNQALGLGIALGEIFDVDQPVAGALQRRDQLIELQMNRERVLVLRSLEQLSSIAS